MNTHPKAIFATAILAVFFSAQTKAGDIEDALDRLMTLGDEAAEMLTWIGARTDYEMPRAMPMIEFLPHDLIAAATGNKNVGAMYYPKNGTMLIDIDMSYETNICAQSVFLHELIHHVQAFNHAFLSPPTEFTGPGPYDQKARKEFIEAEAYNLQRDWLVEHNVNLFHTGWPIAAPLLYTETCP